MSDDAARVGALETDGASGNAAAVNSLSGGVALRVLQQKANLLVREANRLAPSKSGRIRLEEKILDQLLIAWADGAMATEVEKIAMARAVRATLSPTSPTPPPSASTTPAPPPISQDTSAHTRALHTPTET
jgi:hypothetical protein